ncbi:MAG: dTDP-4-dehydrorhamnose 3,5-epimerase [bacterium]|nr:dTDP-4-dehydrorhamnose 3,5-epimerase [bacterium]
MNRLETEIPGVIVLEPRVFSDQRGFFLESWNQTAFEAIGLDECFVQDSHSHSVAGTLRGLHYQISRPQGKLVRVVHGSVFDVVVDLRRSSPTFGQWAGRNLSGANRRMVWIPPGIAHGFYARTEVDFVYKSTEYYDPKDERTIVWNDPVLGIEWPLAGAQPPLLAERDRAGSAFRDAETYP